MTSVADAPVLSLHLQRAALAQRTVLHAMRLDFQPGRWTAVVGPNGAGKSTLLRVLAGLLPCDGWVSLMGRPLLEWTPRERALRLAWSGQGVTGGNDLQVRDVVMLGRLPYRPWFAAASNVDLRAVARALEQTHTVDLASRRMGELSGGERQRVLLARLLATEAPVLLMDEPLAHLDPPHQADWLATVRALSQQGVTVVSVLHELTMALHANDLVIVKNGRQTHHGACQDKATHQVLQQAFDNRVEIIQIGQRWVALPIDVR